MGDKIGRPFALFVCLLGAWALAFLVLVLVLGPCLEGSSCVLRIRFNQLDQRVSEDEPTYGI